MRTKTRTPKCTACVNCVLGDRHWTRVAAMWRDIAAYMTRMADLQAGRGWVRIGVQLQGVGA